MRLKGSSHQKTDPLARSNVWLNATREKTAVLMNVEKIVANHIQKLQFMDLRYEDGFDVESLDSF